jgi:hypothetical protein
MILTPSPVITWFFMLNVSVYKSFVYYDNKLNLMDIENCCVAWDRL